MAANQPKQNQQKAILYANSNSSLLPPHILLCSAWESREMFLVRETRWSSSFPIPSSTTYSTKNKPLKNNNNKIHQVNKSADNQPKTHGLRSIPLFFECFLTVFIKIEVIQNRGLCCVTREYAKHLQALFQFNLQWANILLSKGLTEV